jgi:membrane glycosyltransferase
MSDAVPPNSVKQLNRDRVSTEQANSWGAASKRPGGLLLMCVGWPLGVAVLVAGYHMLLLGAGLRGSELSTALLLFVPFGMFLVISATTWLFGVVAMARRRVPEALNWPAAGSISDVTVQTALVCPIKNEDTAQVFANVLAIWESLRERGVEQLFDIYVVSNSDDPNCWVEEELAWYSVSSRSAGIYYWRRHRKEGKKPANVTEFCERWGSRYEYMVVLDADSLMSADCLITLVDLMECNPRSALMQTAPTIVKGQTLWARLQQFTLWSNGRILQWGERAWQGAASGYYGHNAIVRVDPFMKHCGLPRLPGSPPFGGDILSHDFVEAALLSRAGWGVWLVPELEGSYEECPTTLEEHFSRDRRWSQGDLLNLRLLGTPKLRPANRVRFVMSALRDMSPPLLYVLCGLIVTSADSPTFAAAALLFPFVVWDLSSRQSWAGIPAVGFGISAYTRPVNQWDRTVLRSLSDMAINQVLWLIIAPIRLHTYVMFVVEIACGRDAGWITPRRTAHQSTLRHSLRSYWPHTLVGGTILTALIFTDSWAVWWLAQALLSLILTVPLTCALSSRRAGELLRRRGMLLVPEENAVPQIIARSRELGEVVRQELPLEAWCAALTDETAMAVHRAFLAHGAPLTPQDRESAAAAATKHRAGTALAGVLTNDEKMALLRDPESVWRDIPALDPVIRFPAAVPSHMPVQQLIRAQRRTNPVTGDATSNAG